MLINETPPVIKEQAWDIDKTKTGSLIDRYRSEVVQSYSRKNSRELASTLFQGTFYCAKNKKPFENNFLEEKDAGLSHQFGRSDKSLSSARILSTSDRDLQKVEDIEPTVEKVKVHTKCKQSHKKSRKHKVKSTRKRQSKSSFKKQKHRESKTAPSQMIVPETKKLNSCFELYSCHNHALNRHSVERTKSSNLVNIHDKVCLTSSGPIRKVSLLSEQEKSSHDIVLPPAIHLKSTQNGSVKCNTAANHGSIPMITQTASLKTKSVQLSRNDSIQLPPAFVGNMSPLAALKAEGSMARLTFNRNAIYQRDNRLKDRLTLIHCYGNDYQSVAQQYELKRQKELALKEKQDKAAERIERERKKQEQRKKIYALNKLMTKLEHAKFKTFMAELAQSTIADEI